jgi:hypothetical protein
MMNEWASVDMAWRASRQNRPKRAAEDRDTDTRYHPHDRGQRAEEGGPCRLASLPAALVAKISSFLGCAGELRLARTGRWLHDLVMSHMATARLAQGQLRRLCRRAPHVRHLTWTLTGGEAPNCQPTATLARLSRLESLTLVVEAPFSRWSLPRADYSPSFPAQAFPRLARCTHSHARRTHTPCTHVRT